MTLVWSPRCPWLSWPSAPQQDVTSGVWEQGWSSSSSWAHSQAQPCPCSSCTAFWGLSNSSHQVFLSALTLPPWEGEGRSSLFPAEPVARAFTSTTDRSRRIKESFPGFFSPFSFFFCFNIRCSKHHVKSHSLLRNRRLPRGPGTAGRIPCPCPEWRCGTGQELQQLQCSRGA